MRTSADTIRRLIEAGHLVAVPMCIRNDGTVTSYRIAYAAMCQYLLLAQTAMLR
ncbi:MAG TPA: hypothetical protein VGK04_01655 [Thermoanaerobaculia bacterium]|jgi:hypothetical protein